MPFPPSEFDVYLVYHNRQTYESRQNKIAEVREQSKPPKGNPLFCVRMPQERPLLFPRVRTAGNQARPDRARQGARFNPDRKKPPPATGGQRGRVGVGGLDGLLRKPDPLVEPLGNLASREMDPDDGGAIAPQAGPNGDGLFFGVVDDRVEGPVMEAGPVQV